MTKINWLRAGLGVVDDVLCPEFGQTIIAAAVTASTPTVHADQRFKNWDGERIGCAPDVVEPPAFWRGQMMTVL